MGDTDNHLFLPYLCISFLIIWVTSCYSSVFFYVPCSLWCLTLHSGLKDQEALPRMSAEGHRNFLLNRPNQRSWGRRHEARYGEPKLEPRFLQNLCIKRKAYMRESVPQNGLNLPFCCTWGATASLICDSLFLTFVILIFTLIFLPSRIYSSLIPFCCH